RGVKRVCIPNRSTKSAVRQREHRKRWFRDGQRWRTGCEGRISVSKRRHGLDRCRYRGEDGMKRWVGLGVIADNLINIGHAIGKTPAARAPPHPKARHFLHSRRVLPGGSKALVQTTPRPYGKSEFCAGK